LKRIPKPHDFRRAFALIKLRNGVEIFALQKLMEHSDLQVLRRYVAQIDEDVHTVQMRGSPPSISGKSYLGDSARIGHIK
jgi:site-specific recombinase XerD